MTQGLDEGSSIPLYAQLRELLKGQIREGAFVPGERIPSEDKLNGMYGVSRITVRRALQELVEEGYLVKCPGKGTYVSERIPGMSAQSKVRAKFTQNNDVQSFTEACESNNQRAGAHLISIEEVDGIDEARDFFGFGSEGRLLRVLRIRTADRTPIMVEENYSRRGSTGSFAKRTSRTPRCMTSSPRVVTGTPCSRSRAPSIWKRLRPILHHTSTCPLGSPCSAWSADTSMRTGRPCTLASSISSGRVIPFASRPCTSPSYTT